MSAPITLVGRLGQEPELRFSASGTAVVRLSIVTSRRVKDQTSGEWSDADVTWWDCTGFKTLAENCAASMSKGMAVIANGRAVQENWQDKDGNKRSKIAVKLDSIGPDLTRATAQVQKANGASQQGGGQQRQAAPSGDPWASQGQGQQGGWGGNAPDSQSPPF